MFFVLRINFESNFYILVEFQNCLLEFFLAGFAKI